VFRLGHLDWDQSVAVHRTHPGQSGGAMSRILGGIFAVLAIAGFLLATTGVHQMTDPRDE
jgi:predicted phage tail protein